MAEEGNLRDLSKFESTELGLLTPDRAATTVAGQEGYKVFYEPAEKAEVAKITEDSVWAKVVNQWKKSLKYGKFKKRRSDLAQRYAEKLIDDKELVKEVGPQRS